MSATNYTPIQLYYSTTASAVPLAGNLVNGELAINITDGKLYYKNNSGVVTLLAGAGGTGIVAGSNTQIQFNNNNNFGASANLSFDVANYTPTPAAITLTITNKVDAAGSFTLVIDDSAWSLISSDPELDIDAVNPACFTGRIKIAFAANLPTPAEDNIIFLMFLVRSDGVVVV